MTEPTSKQFRLWTFVAGGQMVPTEGELLDVEGIEAFLAGRGYGQPDREQIDELPLGYSLSYFGDGRIPSCQLTRIA